MNRLSIIQYKFAKSGDTLNMWKHRIEKNLIRLFIILAGLAYIGLFALSFLYSYINVELVNEHVSCVKDNILINLIGIVIVFIILVMAKRLWPKVENRLNANKIAIIFAFFSVCISIYWVLNSGTEVQADQWKICKAAVEMNQGNYESLEQGNYIAECPHQLGMVTILRILFYVFGDYNCLPFQILSAIAVGIIVLYSYKLAKILTDNKAVELMAVFAAFICIPLYFYTPFVYGELLSLAFLEITLYLFLVLMQGESKGWRSFALMLCISAMLLMRKNTIIFIVAMLGVVIVKLFIEKKRVFIIILGTIIAGVVLKTVFLSLLYDAHTPNDVNEIPSILYIAMGTNDDWEYAGWHNGMHVGIFEGNNYDVQVSTEQGVEVIKAFAGICKDNPSYALNFYLRKISSQWIAPMYQSLVMNNNVTGTQAPLVKYIYYNKTAWEIMDGYMNIYQMIVYLSLIGLLIYLWKYPGNLTYYVGLIGIYGGFLFSILWEAKTRYVFPYFIIMIPYSAYGIYLIINKIDNKKKS